MAVRLEDEPCSLLPGSGQEPSGAGRQETGWDWDWDWEWGWHWDWHWDARAMLQEAGGPLAPASTLPSPESLRGSAEAG